MHLVNTHPLEAMVTYFVGLQCQVMLQVMVIATITRCNGSFLVGFSSAPSPRLLVILRYEQPVLMAWLRKL